MYCKKCNRETSGEESFCSFCGEELYEQSNKIKPNKNNKRKTTAIFFIAVVLTLFIILGLTGSKDKEKEIGKEIKNLINKTEVSNPENEKYADVIKKVYEPIEAEYESFNEVFDSADLSDLLEFSSFREIERMKNIVSDLNAIMIAWEKYDKKESEVMNNVEHIVIESLGESEGKRFYSNFEESFNQSLIYGQKYNNAGKDYHNNIILLYNFLIANYNDYKIDYDENGEEGMYFYSEHSLNAFDKYVEDSNRLSENYIQSEKEYVNYMNNKFKKYGISIEDFL